jgi:uncharacterized protein
MKNYVYRVAFVYSHPSREVRMSQPEIESFPTEVAQKLKTYVYRLIDPRNGETFYVGKGQGDSRIFPHAR